MQLEIITPTYLAAVTAMATTTAETLAAIDEALAELLPAGAHEVPELARRREVNRCEAEGRRHVLQALWAARSVERRAALVPCPPPSLRRVRAMFGRHRVNLAIEFLLLRRAHREVRLYLPATASLFYEATDVIVPLNTLLRGPGPQQ